MGKLAVNERKKCAKCVLAQFFWFTYLKYLGTDTKRCKATCCGHGTTQLVLQEGCKMLKLNLLYINLRLYCVFFHAKNTNRIPYNNQNPARTQYNSVQEHMLSYHDKMCCTYSTMSPN